MRNQESLTKSESEPKVKRILQQGAIMMPGHRRRFFTKFLLIIASCTVALLLGEIAVRVCSAVMYRVPLVVSDEQAGWALAPDLRDQIRVGDGGQYVISTDGEGHRITHRTAERSAAINPSVILVGDSFVQGQCVNDTETFAWILAHETSLNVVNLGVLGYGTDQELVSLRAYLEAHPTLEVRDVVVVVFDNDFIDVQVDSHPALGRSKPCFRVRDGRLETAGYRRSLSDRLMDLSSLYWLINSKRALLFKDPEPGVAGGSEVVLACVEAMRDIATRRGARFHVLAHRHLRGLKPFPESVWVDFLHRSGAMDITPDLRAMKGADPMGYDRGHWSAAGHRLVASLVNERLEAASAPKPAPLLEDSASNGQENRLQSDVSAAIKN